MRKVAIVGMGTTKFKARWVDKTYFELAAEDDLKMGCENVKSFLRAPLT